MKRFVNTSDLSFSTDSTTFLFGLLTALREVIVEIHVRKLIKLLQEQGIELILGDDASAFSLKRHNPVFGARPLKRAIQKELQDIAEEVVKEPSEMVQP